MKISRGLLIAAGIAVLAAGCGGSDGTDGIDPGIGAPAASSAATMNMMGTISYGMFAALESIMGTYSGGAAIVAKDLEAFKATEGETGISCDWTGTQTDPSFTCVVWDSQGSATTADHKCDVTGNWVYDPNLMVVELSYNCVNFNPDTSITVDGSYTADITVDLEALSTLTSVKTCFGKQADSTKALAECTIQEGTEFQGGDGTCSWDSDATPLCATAGALFSIQFTVGADGLMVVDPCGTYTYGAGTLMSTAACMPSETLMYMTFTLDGTFNGAVVNETYNVSCEGVI